MHAIHALRSRGQSPRCRRAWIAFCWEVLAVDAGWVNSLQGFVVIAARLGSSFRTPHSVHLCCMPPGRPALVVVSFGLDHNRRYGVGIGAGCLISIRQLPLHSAISSISSVRLAHPPDLLEAKVNIPGLVEASWPAGWCGQSSAKESASERNKIECDRTRQWTASRVVSVADGIVRK
jgi:hypothetical protein